MSTPERTPLFKAIAIFVAGGLVGAFSAVQVAPHLQTEVAGLVRAAPGPGQPFVNPSASGQSLDPTADPTVAPVPANLACARGRNGGATAPGVTGTSITMATTIVRSGIGAAFLGDVQYAMEAIRNKVNRAGGICGRVLNIRYVDDAWDASRGAGYLRNFIKQGVFAIPVAPSSEGLNLVINNGDIKRAGIPVVGTDGMLDNQYRDPWVWPVAAATASSARIMARDAYQRGARHFSIVFDKDYKFGSEAADAYNSEVRRLTGKPVDGYNVQHGCQKSFCGIDSGGSSYSTEVNGFQHGDFEAMFLEPTTALTWMASPGAPRPFDVKYGIGAGQPLFTRAFATSCQAQCDRMWVWTGYKPPIEEYAADPIIKEFVQDLKRTKPDADEFNAFAEGGYVGMLLLVDALKKVGPYLTRDALRRVLDATTLESGLTLQRRLMWSRGNHFANATMRAFAIQYKGTFSGWRAQNTVTDSTPELGTN